ncbi:hypothetical protein AVEN_138240-1 [Araneus ventricosus]|uniref:Uncharacterized protein n=1 Tax=Araneus ventricosus TaxID=182803 RepID=A0A4Y2IP99_ARAVE|nr:hypothetical protein AVEN_138240-1 [Araneus ventricosus]
MRVLQAIADAEHQEVPEAAKIISGDMYMDDILSGATSIISGKSCKLISHNRASSVSLPFNRVVPFVFIQIRYVKEAKHLQMPSPNDDVSLSLDLRSPSYDGDVFL